MIIYLVNRYRSIHTLPLSSLTAKDSRWPTFGYPNLGTNTTDVLFARGDSLTQEDREENSTSLTAETHVCDQKNSICSENRSCKMPKVSSVLQMDSKALLTSEKEEEKTSARSFQVPEVSSASNPTSPRRKISVYCRSFDVVAVQDRREDLPGSNLEVRQSPSDPESHPRKSTGSPRGIEIARPVRSIRLITFIAIRRATVIPRIPHHGNSKTVCRTTNRRSNNRIEYPERSIWRQRV